MTTPLGSGAPPDWVANQVYPIGVAVVHGGVLYRATAVNDNDAPPSASWTAILSGGGGGTPGGNPGDFQYNNSGAFGGAIVSQVSTSELNVAVPTGDPMRIIPLVSNYDNESALLFTESGIHTSLILGPKFTDVSTWAGITLTAIDGTGGGNGIQLELEAIDSTGNGSPGKMTFAIGTSQTTQLVMRDDDTAGSITLRTPDTLTSNITLQTNSNTELVITPLLVTVTGTLNVNGPEIDVQVPAGDPMRIIPLVSNYDNESALLFTETGVHTSLILAPIFTDVSTWSGYTFTAVDGSGDGPNSVALEIEAIQASGNGRPGKITLATGTSQTTTILLHDNDTDGFIALASHGSSIVLDSSAATATVTGTLNVTTAYQINGTPGASGTFTTADAKTVTVTNGIITSIV